jgi:CheY-like chemotaxis protein
MARESPMRPSELGTILVVDDEKEHVELVQRAFEKANIKNPIQSVENGERALAYLEGLGEFWERKKFPLPVLILLDVKMPKMGGLQFLQWLRSRRELRRIPVVVFTVDDRPETIRSAYDCGANSYLIKPAKAKDVLTLVDKMGDYWLRTNKPDGVVLQLKAAASGDG